MNFGFISSTTNKKETFSDSQNNGKDHHNMDKATQEKNTSNGNTNRSYDEKKTANQVNSNKVHENNGSPLRPYSEERKDRKENFKVTIYYPKSIEDASDENIDRDDNTGNKKRNEGLPERDLFSDRANTNKLLKYFFPDILKAIGNKAIKENSPSLQELEQYLQEHLRNLEEKHQQMFRHSGNQSGNRYGQYYKDKDQINQDISNANDNSNNVKGRSVMDKSEQKNYSSSSSSSISQNQNYRHRFNLNLNLDNQTSQDSLPIITELIKKGYLVDSSKWLRKKGFLKAGQQLLGEIIKSLKTDKLGMHETKFTGTGSVLQETSRKYEFGNELSNININATIQNFIERNYNNNRLKKNIEQLDLNIDNSKNNMHEHIQKQQKIEQKNHHFRKIEFPLDVTYEDIEVYESIEEIKVATVYCIDLSSTMKYSSMYNDLSRIEASKRALWSLYILNKKFFPLDSIYVIGFGSVASKIDIMDIPFLKTFEPNADFLHYTNYQAAYRLAKKILKKDGSKNKRIVMITDGHPSACFIDDSNEKDRILKQRPYSHFYIPDSRRLNPQYLKKNNIKLDIHEKQTVYLCYRYRQIDQYIGEQTIKEAKKIKKDGIDMDTIMVSEEDTLLDFVDELAKSVMGKSIYINPKDIDKILITDYLLNKKKMIKKN